MRHKILDEMCQYKESQVNLCESQMGCISWCKNCQLLSMTYGTCTIAFTKSEFVNFREILYGLDEKQFISSFGSKETLFLRSTKCNMGICLTREQLDELKEMCDEASHMQEIFSLVYQ